MYQTRWRVDRFYTFAVFHFGSLLKSILDHLGIDFGVVLGSIFEHCSDQGGDQKIITIFPESSEFKRTEDIQQNLITSSNIYPITYKVRKDKNGNWLIINIIVNGVNLGLTFRNQFQALAKEHNENIDEIIKHWTSDANLD